MAYTKILKIKSTPKEAIEYIKENKEMKSISQKESMDENGEKNLLYIMRDKRGNTYELSAEYLKFMKNYIYEERGQIVFETISNSINCSVEYAHEEFEMVRKLYKNHGNIIQYQIIQNFGMAVDPELANKIGMEFAEKYLNKYQCVVSTHINTGHVHNHIDFNAVSFLTGKKFYDQLKTKTEIRRISDELCRKYGLPVLEKTEKAHFMKYETPDGKIKFFEPTERKMNSKDGYSNNDYRNSDTYQSYEKPKTHREELMQDVEKVLKENPVFTYENLLDGLREIGYHVKDKTKIGEQRKHISFQKDGWGKAVRETNLSKEYQRAVLTNRIVNMNKKREDVYIFADADYHYGKIDIEKLHDDYRYQNVNGAPVKIPRTELEVYIIRDVKKQNNALELEFNNAKEIRAENGKITNLDKRTYFLNCIEDSLKTLRFVEKKKLSNFSSIRKNIGIIYQKRNRDISLLNHIKHKLSYANENITIIKRYNALNLKFVDGKFTESDKIVFATLEKTLQRRNIFSVEQQGKYIRSYEENMSEFHKLNQELSKASEEITEYDLCVKSIKRMDMNYAFYTDDIRAYEIYREELENHASVDNIYENKKGYSDREIELE